jgi:hemerythrin-like domain-containing protein
MPMPPLVDDPIDQFERSHRKLEERMAELARSPFDPKARTDFIGFLERSVRRHEDDEEASLFPRLAHMTELAQTIAMLREEHRAEGDLQRALCDAKDEPTATRALDVLRAAYARHITLEESVLFPAARGALDEGVLRAILDEMQARRGGGGERARER